MDDSETKRMYHQLLLHDELLGKSVQRVNSRELIRIAAAFMCNMSQIGVPLKDKKHFFPMA
jgi:hypothetical protein